MKKKKQAGQEEQAQEIQLPEWVRIVNNYLKEAKKIKRITGDKNG